MRNKMLEITKSNSKKCDSVNTMKDIRDEQKVNSSTKLIKINEKINIGKRRWKPRLASDITMLQLNNPMTDSQKMTVSKFKRRVQILYITEKNRTLLQSSINEEEELEIYWTDIMTLKNIEDITQ